MAPQLSHFLPACRQAGFAFLISYYFRVMKKFILAIVPFILAVLTFVIIKPSDEKCRKVGIERLATINIKASPENILVQDYLVVKVLKYVHNADTFKLGTGFFLQVKVNDRKLENIQKNIKP
jgi:hypothetical protein